MSSGDSGAVMARAISFGASVLRGWENNGTV